MMILGGCKKRVRDGSNLIGAQLGINGKREATFTETFRDRQIAAVIAERTIHGLQVQWQRVVDGRINAGIRERRRHNFWLSRQKWMELFSLPRSTRL